MSFGALLSALSGEAGSVTPEVVAAPAAAVSAPPVPVAAAVGAGGLAGLQVGLDVEDVRELPVASDYWEHAFYRGSFSRSEISYAILQTDPRTHFAGFWCAKEALRKCDRSFASVSPAATAVAHESNGSPYLIFESDARFVRLPHSLSISHTAEMATAIVVAVPAATIAAAPVEAPVPAAGVVAVEAVSSPAEAVAPAKKAGGLGRLFVARQA